LEQRYRADTIGAAVALLNQAIHKGQPTEWATGTNNQDAAARLCAMLFSLPV